MKSNSDRSLKIVVVASKVPPAHSGSGYSALKYSGRLMRSESLAFLLTGKTLNRESLAGLDDNLICVLQERCRRVGALVRHFPKIGKITVWKTVTEGVGALWVLFRNRNDFDIVHCFAPTWLSFFSGIAAKVLRKKLVVEITLLGGDCPESGRGDLFRIANRRRRFQFKIANAIVCLTPAIKEVCVRNGISEGKCYVTPRAVDRERFFPVGVEEKNRLRSDLRLPINSTIILFVGGILYRKGIDLLIEGFDILSKRDKDIVLVIVGPFDIDSESIKWGQRVVEFSERADMRGRVFIAGKSLEVEKYMKTADLFVCLSRREGFGNVFVEAMVSELPVVGLDIPGIRDFVIKDEQTGYLVREHSGAAIADVIMGALNDRRIRRNIASNARREALNRFSPAAVDAAYKNIYSSI